MSKSKFEKGSKIVYYAEGTPYTGPFPAFIEEVHPVDKDNKSAPPAVDLRVHFNGLNASPHVKTNVKYALEPTKHHWSEVPADWAWPEA